MPKFSKTSYEEVSAENLAVDSKPVSFLKSISGDARLQPLENKIKRLDYTQERCFPLSVKT